jgi:predicted transcriptional regulator
LQYGSFELDSYMDRTSLTEQQREALALQPDGIEVEDPETNKVYVLADADLHREAMRALAERNDRDAIRTGIADMEAGRVVSFEEVDRGIRAKLEGRQPST